METEITRDSNRLKELEGVISKDLKSFFEVGSALMEIRDNELYKTKNGGEYNTFEAYCKGVWDFTKSYANYLIASNKVIDNLTTIVVKPTTESQTRPIARLEPSEQREAWQKAVDTAPEGKITAAHVNKVVREMIGEQVITKTESKPSIPEHAIYFAKIAISQLERISKDDPTREKALEMVEKWIKQNRRENK